MNEHLTDEADDLGPSHWQQIGTIADRMIMAWDKVEERENVMALVAYSTHRQRWMLWREIWMTADEETRAKAKAWIENENWRAEVAKRASAAE